MVEYIIENDPVIRMMTETIEKDKLKNITFVLREYAGDFIVKTKGEYLKKQLDHKLVQIKKLLSLKRNPIGFIKDFFSKREIISIPKKLPR